MPMRLASLVVSVCVVIAAATPGHAADRVPRVATVSSCMPPDGYSDNFRDYLFIITAPTDTSSAKARATFHLPQIDSTKVVYVRDSLTCARAARAHALAAAQDTINPAPVHLLRVGTFRYVAFNGMRTGEYLTYFVFDDAFQLLASVIS
jgi:hypothetical protein